MLADPLDTDGKSLFYAGDQEINHRYINIYEEEKNVFISMIYIKARIFTFTSERL